MKNINLRVIIFLISCLFILNSCSSLYYYPIKEELIDRTRLPVQPNDIYFNSQNGKKLHGWYFNHRNENPEKPNRTKAIIVHFHGNAQNISTHFMQLYFVLDYDYDYFIFDYQGYGESEGSPNPEKTVQDGLAALNWVQNNNPKLPIIVVGQSLGGIIALKTIIEFQKISQNSKEFLIPNITIDSSFINYKSVSQDTVSKSWLTWWLQPIAWLIMDNSMSPEKELSSLKNTRFIIIHGTKDRVVDYKFGEELYVKLPEPKIFVKLDGGQHTDYFWRDKGVNQKKWIEMIDATLNN